MPLAAITVTRITVEAWLAARTPVRTGTKRVSAGFLRLARQVAVSQSRSEAVDSGSLSRCASRQTVFGVAPAALTRCCDAISFGVINAASRSDSARGRGFQSYRKLKP